MATYRDNYIYITDLNVLELDAIMVAEVSDDGEENIPGIDITDPLPDADEVIDANLAGHAVRSFMASLPARSQDVLYRIFWNGEAPATVARAIGISKPGMTKLLRKLYRQARFALMAFRNLEPATLH